MKPTLLLVPLLALAAAAAPGARGAAAGPAEKAPGPRIVVLGTAQDGGLPQTGCSCAHCAAARRDPALVRRVASLAIDFPASGRTFLVDATPDLPAQIEAIHRFRRHPEGKVDRAPVDGVILTHAHIGHYLGLAHFGFESVNTHELPVHCSPRMAAFLRANGPWSQLVRLDNVALHEFRIGEPFSLGEGVTVTPLQVPHRDEYTDTMGFVIRGPRQTVLYVPDTDSWRTWPRPLPEVLKAEKVDVALLDGTFYSPEELPDRDVTKIKHPLVTASMDLLAPLVRAGLRVEFTHLNHSNPAVEKDGPAAKAIAARGFRVAADGEEIGL
jgi:pyrroloquinoline quinone biosynthesis protein B